MPRPSEKDQVFSESARRVPRTPRGRHWSFRGRAHIRDGPLIQASNWSRQLKPSARRR